MKVDKLTHNELNIVIENIENLRQEIKQFDENVKRIIPKWERTSTLLCPNLENFKRRSGNTTKQCDFAIELIMSGYIVKVEDHFENGENKQSNQFLFNKIIERLQKEHNLSYLLHKKVLSIDYKNLEIFFRNEF